MDFFKEELKRYREEHPIQEVIIRKMRYSPKDLIKRTPDTYNVEEAYIDPQTGKEKKKSKQLTETPEYFHFKTLEEALAFIREMEEKYSQVGIKPERPFPGIWCFGAVEYMMIIRRFGLEEVSQKMEVREEDLNGAEV